MNGKLERREGLRCTIVGVEEKDSVPALKLRFERASRRERVRVWWQNFQHVHERWMMRYLKRRGWVVFYLDERSRNCKPENPGCWLRLYQDSEARDQNNK